MDLKNIVLFKYLFLLLSVFEGPSSPPGPISWKEFVCMYSLLGLKLAEKMFFKYVSKYITKEF